MDSIVLDPEVSAAEDRQHARFEGRVPCQLRVGDAVWTAWIRDLSLGGAGLEPAMPATLDRPVELICPALEIPGVLAGRVVNVAHRRTCIAFELDPEVEAQLFRFLEQNT